MKALISPNEPVQNGYRIAQVEPNDKIFDVTEPLYWLECNDDVVADQWYYDTNENVIKLVTNTNIINGQQPRTTGSQTL